MNGPFYLVATECHRFAIGTERDARHNSVFVQLLNRVNLLFCSYVPGNDRSVCICADTCDNVLCGAEGNSEDPIFRTVQGRDQIPRI